MSVVPASIFCAVAARANSTLWQRGNKYIVPLIFSASSVCLFVYSPVRNAAIISVIGVRIEVTDVTIWCDASVIK